MVPWTLPHGYVSSEQQSSLPVGVIHTLCGGTSHSSGYVSLWMQPQVKMYIPSHRASWPGLPGGCDYLARYMGSSIIHPTLKGYSRNQRVRSHSPEMSQVPPDLSNKLLISTVSGSYQKRNSVPAETIWWVAKTVSLYYNTGFPGGTRGKEPACKCRSHKIHWFNPWVRKIPCKRAQQPNLVFLLGESCGERSQAG